MNYGNGVKYGIMSMHVSLLSLKDREAGVLVVDLNDL